MNLDPDSILLDETALTAAITGYPVTPSMFRTNFVRLYEILCDSTPCNGRFRARQILIRKGVNKDYATTLLRYLCLSQLSDEDRLIRVSKSEYRWNFAREEA
jgi:hypothetical protein